MGRGRLTLATITKVLRKYAFSEVTLSGGEPFYHPQFREIARHLLDQEYKVSLNTCGLSNDHKHTYFYAAWDKDERHPGYLGKSYAYPDLIANFTRIYVSIYGDRKVHNAITRAPSFDATLSFYLQARLLMHRRKGQAVINVPIFSSRQVRTLIELLSLYDPLERAYFSHYHIAFTALRDTIHFIRLLPHGRGGKIRVLPRERQLAIARKVQQTFPRNVVISESLRHESCNWESKRTLLPDGRLIHCVAGKHHPTPDQPFVCDEIVQRRNSDDDVIKKEIES